MGKARARVPKKRWRWKTAEKDEARRARRELAELFEAGDESGNMQGMPGPNGEDPESGQWNFESKGAGEKKRWKWKSFSEEEEDEEDVVPGAGVVMKGKPASKGKGT